jgi:hypothetical protein
VQNAIKLLEVDIYMNKKCRHCKKDISESRLRKKAIYCSIDCAKKDQLKIDRSRNPNWDLSNGTSGAVNELVVAVDLFRMHIAVFRALSPNAPCDLIGIYNGNIKRIEVRTARMNRKEGYNFGKKNKADIMAVVITNSKIMYYNCIDYKVDKKLTETELKNLFGIYKDKNENT